MKNSIYLPHLDGLRALAVSLVIVYHSGLGFFRGGFIGVDIFFVLSGFLITNQIVNQINNATFTFKAFYLRRIRRLIPAFATVSLATLLVGYIVLLPKDFIYHAKLAVLSFLSVGNFYISNTTKGYFAPQSEEIPLLHTWSLSVEEQYYLLWPLLLTLIFKHIGKERIFGFLTVFLVISLAFSEWLVNHHPSNAYYLLPARVYELLVGSLLAIVFDKLPELKRQQALALSILGVFTLIFSVFYLGADKPFPGLNGLSVCLATAVLIYSGMFHNQVTNIFSQRLFVGIGKISYSLYLWHWPVFSFLRYVEGGLSVVQILIAIAISFVLSFLSWKYVEIPFREKWNYSFRRTYSYLYILPVIIITAIFLLIDWEDGLPDRFSEKIATIEAIDKNPSGYEEKCDATESENCLSILLFGDSHAAHFIPFIKALILPNLQYNLTISSVGTCPPLLDIIPIETRSGEKTIVASCLERNQQFYKNIENFDYVILAAYWAIPGVERDKVFFSEKGNKTYSLEKSMEVLRKTIYKSVDSIVARGGVPVIIKDNPAIGKELFKCTVKRILYSSFDSTCEMSREKVNKQQQEVENIFFNLVEDHPEVVFINPNDVMCSDVKCISFLDGVPLYHDEHHLNTIGSKLLGEKYLDGKGSPFIIY